MARPPALEDGTVFDRLRDGWRAISERTMARDNRRLGSRIHDARRLPPVPFVALDRAHQRMRDQLDEAIARVIVSSAFILGEEVEAFEAAFAHYCGAKRCVGVSSGTSALAISLRALGIGAGDEVVVPAHTYIASALGVIQAGATPVFSDVDPETGLIDLRSAAEVVTERTAAILPVHLYGQMCDMAAVIAFARKRGLAIVEDAAQAHGARWDELRAGQAGDVAAFSFYPSKNLGALGDGGAVVTSDLAVAARAARLRNLGQRVRGQHEIIGYNERLDGLQAALLRTKLPTLDASNVTRRWLARRYARAISDQAAVLPDRDGAENIYHLFPIRCRARDAIAAAMARAGVQTGIHYSPALHEQPPFRHLEARTDLSAAATWARTELSLPMFPELRDDEFDRVTTTLNAALREETLT